MDCGSELPQSKAAHALTGCVKHGRDAHPEGPLATGENSFFRILRIPAAGLRRIRACAVLNSREESSMAAVNRGTFLQLEPGVDRHLQFGLRLLRLHVPVGLGKQQSGARLRSHGDFGENGSMAGNSCTKANASVTSTARARSAIPSVPG